MLTSVEALSIVSLAAAKAELRIPPFSMPEDPAAQAAAAAAEKRHDDLLIGQIYSAANFVHQATGLALADMQPLRSAIVSAVRDLYNGEQKIGPNAAAFSLLAPFRSFKAG